MSNRIDVIDRSTLSGSASSGTASIDELLQQHLTSNALRTHINQLHRRLERVQGNMQYVLDPPELQQV